MKEAKKPVVQLFKRGWLVRFNDMIGVTNVRFWPDPARRERVVDFQIAVIGGWKIEPPWRCRHREAERDP